MIKDGFLCRVIGRKILTTTSIEEVSIRNGDFVAQELSNAVNIKARNDFIVQKFKLYAPDRKGVAFCADVKHCIDLANTFNSQGVKSAAIYGSMNKTQRQDILNGLKNGDIKIVTSCGVLTEGFDEPTIDVILMCRPTRSKSLYIQCVGRGLRNSPDTNKTDCLVLDFADNTHNLNAIVSLSTAIPQAKQLKDNTNNSKEKLLMPKIIPNKVVEVMDEEFDLLSKSSLHWIYLADNEYSLIDGNNIEIVIYPKEDGYVADLWQGNLNTNIINTPLSFEECIKVCEDFAKESLDTRYIDLNGGWLKEAATIPATSGQFSFLKRYNFSLPDNISKAQASARIREIFAIQNKERRMQANDQITERQKSFLKQANINTENMSKKEAIRIISEMLAKQ